MTENKRPEIYRDVCNLCLSTIKVALSKIKTGEQEVGIRHLEKLVNIISQWHVDLDIEEKQFNEEVCDGNETRREDD